MKRVFTLLIIILSMFIFAGCNEVIETEKSEKGLEQLSNNQDSNIPLEEMSSVTYVKNDTYNYKNVIKCADSFDILGYANASKLTNEDDYFVIDNYWDWLKVYMELTDSDIYSLSEEDGNKLFDNKVYLIFVRKAPASNLIKVVYQFDNTNNKFVKTYPYINDHGDEAISNCFDVVEVPKEIYNIVKDKTVNNIDYTEYLFHSIKFDKDKYKQISTYEEMTSFISKCELEETINDKYNKVFFENNSLVALMIPESSGENTHNLTINTEDNKLIINYDLKNAGETCDMAYWLVFAEIEKEDWKKINRIEFVRGNITSELINYPEEDDTIDNKYKLTVKDDYQLLFEALSPTYKAGEKITVKVGRLFDAGVEVFLDNKSLGRETQIDDNIGYWEYYFIMPEHDAVLSLRQYDGFTIYNEYVSKYLPSDTLSRGIQEEIIYNYLFRDEHTPEADEKGYIIQFLGYYNDSFMVKIKTNKMIDSINTSEETIDGINFKYNDDNRIYAYKKGKFYNLYGAFENKLLTHDDLINIQELNNINEKTYSLEDIIESSKEDIISGYYMIGFTEAIYPLDKENLYNVINTLNTKYMLTRVDELPLEEDSDRIYHYCFTTNDDKTFSVSWSGYYAKLYINDKVYISIDTLDLTPKEKLNTVNDLILGIDDYDLAWITYNEIGTMINVNLKDLKKQVFFQNILSSEYLEYKTKLYKTYYLLNLSSDTKGCHFLVSKDLNDDYFLMISTNNQMYTYTIKSRDDIKALYDYLNKLRYPVVETYRSEITIELANEIKLAYAQTYRKGTEPITLYELDNIGIRYYLGCFNGYHIVMMEGYFEYNEALVKEVIDGVVINYSDGNSLLAYKDGLFISLVEAYNKKYITKEDLSKISELHKNSKSYDIVIAGTTTRTLNDLIDYEKFNYFHVFDEKNKVEIKSNILLSDYNDVPLLQRILSSPCNKTVNRDFIHEEIKITLSTNLNECLENYSIDLYLGDNIVYSSIKKELIVNINDEYYYVVADRNDMLDLYLYLIKSNDDYLINNEKYSLDELLPILRNSEEVTLLSQLRTIDNMCIDDSLVNITYFQTKDNDKISKLIDVISKYEVIYLKDGVCIIDSTTIVSLCTLVLQTDNCQYTINIETNHSTWITINDNVFLCESSELFTYLGFPTYLELEPLIADDITKNEFYNMNVNDYIEKRLIELSEQDLKIVIYDGCIKSGLDDIEYFYSKTKDGIPLTIEIEQTYVLDEERCSPEYYNTYKNDYPKTFIKYLSYDGSYYNCNIYYKGQLDTVYSYKYLKMEYSKLFKATDYSLVYYFVNDEKITYKDIVLASLSSIRVEIPGVSIIYVQEGFDYLEE